MAPALLRPSFAPVWGNCSAAVMAGLHAPDIETDASREGTAAHWVLSEVLSNFKSALGRPLLCAWYIGKTAPNGVVIDEKMAEGAQIAVDDILIVAQKYGALPSMFVEYPVSMPHIHPENRGTLDCAIVVPGKIFIWDYKHGHRECRAEGNLQLIDYVEGLRHELNLGYDLSVSMRVVQPFCYSTKGAVDEWTGTLPDLQPVNTELSKKAAQAFSAPTFTSGKHCRDCPVVGKCAGARQAAYSLIDVVNEPYEMDNMTGADLATERQILTDGLVLVKERLGAIEADLEHRIRNGAKDTGLALGTQPGRRKWLDTVPAEQAAALATQFGFNISRTEVKTPRQSILAAPKEVRAQFEMVVGALTHRPPGKLKLINAQDSVTARAFKRKK